MHKEKPHSRSEVVAEINHYIELNTRVAMAVIQFTGESLLDVINNRVAMVAMRQAARELLIGVLPFPSEAGVWCVGVNEMVVAWKHMDGGLGADEITKYLKRLLSKDLNISGVRIEFDTSIGVAIFPKEAGNAEQLIGLAEWRRMASVSCFGSLAKSGAGSQSNTSASLEMEVRAGLVSGAFNFLFKPQVDMLEGRLAGFTAKLRWAKDARGGCDCHTFRLSDLAIGSELAERFWRVVFADFCVEARNLCNRFKVKTALVLGADDLGGRRVIDLLQESMSMNGLTGDQICVAISTEGTQTDKETIMSIVAKLRSAGIGVAIADAGSNNYGIELMFDARPDLMIMAESFGRRSLESEWLHCIEFYIRVAERIDSKVVFDGVDCQLSLNACIAAGCPAGSGRVWSDYKLVSSFLSPEFHGLFRVDPGKPTWD